MVKNAWRLSRTVVLPDYQGMGIGTRISDAVAEILWREGKRVFTKSMSPAIVRHRNNSPLWTGTAKDVPAKNTREALKDETKTIPKRSR